jgi:hypothetical protein
MRFRQNRPLRHICALRMTGALFEWMQIGRNDEAKGLYLVCGPNAASCPEAAAEMIDRFGASALPALPSERGINK